MPSTTITISVVQDKVYKVTGPAGLDAYYSGKKVLGSGAINYFVANGSTDLVLSTSGTVTGSVVVTEVLRNYYQAYDGQGGTWVFQPSVDHWTGQYSFRPEWYGHVANRLVSFKSGQLYIHSGSNNSFYGTTFDSAVAVAHSEAGNSIKVYRSLAVEGDTPDRTHIRTEVPYVQSSDLVAGDYTVKEGVKYAAVLRDRLSPNETGTYDQKLFKGDIIRGDLGKLTILYSAPGSKKELKFINIDFDQSQGQTV